MVFKRAQLSTKERFWKDLFFARGFGFEVPFSATFKTALKPWQVVADAFFCLAFLPISLSFRSEKDEKLMTTETKYLWFSYIFLDAIACIPFDVIVYTAGSKIAPRYFIPYV